MKIELKELTKIFDNTKAVNNINALINDGELVCLLGPSGCGKTTTLNMIAGLDNPSKGEILFDNKCVNNIPSENRDIGMVFQNYALYPHMTAENNILFPLKMNKTPKDERKKRIEHITEILQIENYLNRKPSELSGGQQQRIAIARALIKQPKLLLLDEPFSNLDARLRIELREEIRNLQQKLKITTIFVTHDQEEAMSISDKIILLNYGIMQQYSKPIDMYHKPKNCFVAKFLGNPPINFLNATIHNNQLQIANTDLNFSINGSNTCLHTSENDVVVGIRPEDIVNSSEQNTVKYKIIAMQTLGKEIYLKLEFSNMLLTASMPWNIQYKIGDNIGISINKFHIFSKKDYEKNIK